MIKIMLSNDRTEVDMERLAAAFAMNRNELWDCIRVGTTTYWFELGASDRARPHMIFHSADTGVRVTLDSSGVIISRTNDKTKSPRVEPIPTEDQVFVPGDMPVRRIDSIAVAAALALKGSENRTQRSLDGF